MTDIQETALDTRARGAAGDHHDLADLFKALRDETSLLLREEVALARTEMSEKVSHAARNATKLAVGGFVAYLGVALLLTGMAMLLSWGLVAAGLTVAMAAWVGFAIVGTVVAVIGWGMVNSGKRELAHERMYPDRTMSSMKENARWARQKME